jgi:hypothetical protein
MVSELTFGSEVFLANSSVSPALLTTRQDAYTHPLSTYACSSASLRKVEIHRSAIVWRVHVLSCHHLRSRSCHHRWTFKRLDLSVGPSSRGALPCARTQCSRCPLAMRRLYIQTRARGADRAEADIKSLVQARLRKAVVAVKLAEKRLPILTTLFARWRNVPSETMYRR